ncbi:unnamed protein product [Ilex paraguariensis]|uniref:Uncharacterized protein n=1 Tax=Ilex paraguariensis TaxID=185542 RepID=A0ABC8UR89_9AQUA
MTVSAYLSHREFLLYMGGMSYLPGSQANMFRFYFIFSTWIILSLSCSVFSGPDSCCPHNYARQTDQQFQQKIDRFWEFEEQSNSWVEVKLPYDLFSCINDNCTKVDSIDRKTEKAEEPIERKSDVPEQQENFKKKNNKGGLDRSSMFLPMRKRVSLIKMSESSIWVTGESGSIYERFWNGLQWVIAPHDLPVSAGYAVSIFMVNQTILALSEAGHLHQMKLSENSQPVWVEFTPAIDLITIRETEQTSAIQLKSGAITQDRERIYFCTKKGSLLELNGVEPPRWLHHGRPPGADVAAIADAATIRPEVIFTVSSTGDLYEFDPSSKPSWKKHIWREGSAQNTSLSPSMGCGVHGLNGAHSMSLFLLTKGGILVERRIQQRKWKWIVHGSPEDHPLSSITPVSQDELNDKSYSLFLTTGSGFIFEYRIPKQSACEQDLEIT